MRVFWYQVYQARLQERLLITRGLLIDSTCVLNAESGKLDIKKTQTLYFMYQFTHSFTLQTNDNVVIIIPPVYEVYRGYIVFAFSVIMFVCLFVCLSVCKLFFSVKDFSATT